VDSPESFVGSYKEKGTRQFNSRRSARNSRLKGDGERIANDTIQGPSASETGACREAGFADELFGPREGMTTGLFGPGGGAQIVRIAMDRQLTEAKSTYEVCQLKVLGNEATFRQKFN
jgi:hypothetical protein